MESIFYTVFAVHAGTTAEEIVEIIRRVGLKTVILKQIPRTVQLIGDCTEVLYMRLMVAFVGLLIHRSIAKIFSLITADLADRRTNQMNRLAHLFGVGGDTCMHM